MSVLGSCLILSRQPTFVHLQDFTYTRTAAMADHNVTPNESLLVPFDAEISL